MAVLFVPYFSVNPCNWSNILPRNVLLALAQSYDHISASEVFVMDVGKIGYYLTSTKQNKNTDTAVLHHAIVVNISWDVL